MGNHRMRRADIPDRAGRYRTGTTTARFSQRSVFGTISPW